MFRVSFALLTLALPVLTLAARSPAQGPPAVVPAAQPTPTVSVPLYPNVACPIMGKPISARLFAETEKGRIYVCCKSCIKDILDDVEIAYRSAYPTDVARSNATCPVTGGEISKESPTVVLQGFVFSVRDAAAAQTARQNAQVVLAKLHDPKLIDLANATCPISGTAVAKNTVVVIDGHLVHLSSAKLLDEVQKEPARVLAKAKELRAKPADASK